jgi:hypothetical protein
VILETSSRALLFASSLFMDVGTVLRYVGYSTAVQKKTLTSPRGTLPSVLRVA